MFNKVVLIGRLGSEVKIKSVGEKMVANFSLATQLSDKHTDWHNIVAWEKQANNCAKYLSKGSMACVEGRITTRKWEDAKTGQKHSITEVVANDVRFLSPSNKVHDVEKEWNAQAGAAFEDMELNDVPF